MEKHEKLIDTKGRVLIPRKFLCKLGIYVPTYVYVYREGENKIVIEKIKEEK